MLGASAEPLLLHTFTEKIPDAPPHPTRVIARRAARASGRRSGRPRGPACQGADGGCWLTAPPGGLGSGRGAGGAAAAPPVALLSAAARPRASASRRALPAPA